MKLFFRVLIICVATLSFYSVAYAASEKPLIVILDWFVNPTQGPILIAQEKGLFKAEGLNVKIAVPRDPDDTTKMVAIGKADIGIGSDPELLISLNEGLPLMRIGALIDQPLSVLTVSASTGIKSIRDLKGKTIGYPVGGIDKVTLSMMLEKTGLTLKDVKLLNVHYNLIESLRSTRVDAITGSFRNYEVPELQLLKFPIITFYPEKYGMPFYAELNYIINPVNKNDPRLIKFLRAIQKATLYIKENPQKSWSILTQKYPELAGHLNEVSWNMTYSLFADYPGYTNQKNFMQLVTTMQNIHWLSANMQYSQCVVELPN